MVWACEAAPFEYVKCVECEACEACGCTAAVHDEDAKTLLMAHAAVEEAWEARIADSVAVPGGKAAEDTAAAGTIAEDSEAREVVDSTAVDDSMPGAPGEDMHIGIHSVACLEPSGSEACRAS